MNLSHIHGCNKRSHETREVEEKVHLFAEWIPAAHKDLVMQTCSQKHGGMSGALNGSESTPCEADEGLP